MRAGLGLGCGLLRVVGRIPVLCGARSPGRRASASGRGPPAMAGPRWPLRCPTRHGLLHALRGLAPPGLPRHLPPGPAAFPRPPFPIRFLLSRFAALTVRGATEPRFSTAPLPGSSPPGSGGVVGAFCRPEAVPGHSLAHPRSRGDLSEGSRP